MDIKAIETNYKGYRYRSRLEARWAVFFDALGIKYEYEKEGFDLGDGIWYLPDFWLPDRKCWIEIKPDYPNNTDLTKFNAFISMTTYPVFMCIGVPEIPIYDGEDWIGNTAMFECSGVSNAVTASKSARFEHGESPITKKPFQNKQYETFTSVVTRIGFDSVNSRTLYNIQIDFDDRVSIKVMALLVDFDDVSCRQIPRPGSACSTLIHSIEKLGYETYINPYKHVVNVYPDITGKKCTFIVNRNAGNSRDSHHWKLVKVV